MSFINLTASDGHDFDAYVAEPKGTPRGALVVLQEIFGVNSHIQSVVDGFAADGYLAIAPAIFDRTEKNVDLGYEGDDMTKARALMGQLDIDKTLLDVQASIDYAAKAGKVGVVGYCLGGRLAWLAACQLNGLSAAVTYYGGGMPALAHLKARVPVLAHFGENDHGIPLVTVEEFRGKQPDVKVELYPAGHGFSCDARAAYEQASAKLARERTIDFFNAHIG
ncbi:dienelactone hydrolase family protein [soil metagenome]